MTNPTAGTPNAECLTPNDQVFESIGVDQLRDFLAQVRGATPVNFVALTEPEQKKIPGLDGKVKKLVRVNAMTGCRYANALAAATGREAKEERAWGAHEDSALVTKPTKGGEAYYLPVQLNHVSAPVFVVAGPDGRPLLLTAERVLPFLRLRPEPPVQYKDYRLDSIVSIAVLNRRFNVRSFAAAQAKEWHEIL